MKAAGGKMTKTAQVKRCEETGESSGGGEGQMTRGRSTARRQDGTDSAMEKQNVLAYRGALAGFPHVSVATEFGAATN